MAKRRRGASLRPRIAVPIRVAKHIERLGLHDASGYIEWCRAHGLRASIQKSWAELEGEWCVHGRHVVRTRRRCRVDRDPGQRIADVCAGSARASEMARPRWRSLAERIEEALLAPPEREALRVLVQVAQRRANFLLAEATFGNTAYPFLDGLIALSQRCNAWIRAPGEWRARTHNAHRQFTSLARHLVARHAVPGFLDAAWTRRDALAERYRDWFLHIGSGENLRSTAAPIRWTNRIVHHFLRAPEPYSIEQALRWGQIHALGGDPSLVQAVLGTRLGESFEHEDFWITVIRFLVAHPELDRVHVGPIVDYLHEQRYAARDVFVARGVRAQLPAPQPNLSMTGRSPASLLRQVDRWHRELGRGALGADHHWARSAIREFELEVGKPGDDLRVWRIRELLSAAELRHEGSVLRHCVATYASACAARRCSIWTMEIWDSEGVRKRQTIEVQGRVIVQCRGRTNALPSGSERKILSAWAAQEGLQLSRSLL